MKALRIHDYGAALRMDEVPAPAARANGVDPGRASGFLRQIFPLQFPWIPGGDVAGRVAAAGEEVTAFQVGDEVFGYIREGRRNCAGRTDRKADAGTRSRSARARHS